MVTAELTDNPWIKGGKIGRRYTLSQMVLAKPEQVIWKAADEKLNIECFILYVVSASRSELREIAWNMICHESEPGCPIVHGMYRAAGRDVVIFSRGEMAYTTQTEAGGHRKDRKFSAAGTRKTDFAGRFDIEPPL